ncbi:NTP transferase domain-containing protein [Hydrogenovibrio kuenenii]|uniref:NTP transferase domain-containing protein n=1 Tax=Hydrogenovibrio kuenenii TaxID=63658 RepID=UPI000464438A|nr:NTP transferase domain-containing protein [Hydrogenovibrio kuenenii]
MPSSLPNIGIIILAGGEGKRMGGVDKGWCLYQETPMIVQVLGALETQYQSLYGEDASRPFFISANRNLSDYQALDYPVISDKRPGFCGPLSGIESVFNAGQVRALKIDRWITYPVDSPIVPQDYLERMALVKSDRFGVWRAGSRSHFVNLSLPSGVLPEITQYLNFGNRSIKGWLTPRSQQTDFVSSLSGLSDDQTSSFLNLNSPSDLA